MPVQFRFEVDGDVQVSRRLEGIRRGLIDLSPAFRKIHTSFLALERKQFNTEGASGSRGWKPLKPETVRRKVRMRDQGVAVDGRAVVDTRILHMTHRLRESLTRKTSKDHVVEIKKYEAFFGTSVPYAGVHQNPKASNPRGVRRRPVELTENQRRAWMRTIQKHIIETRGR